MSQALSRPILFAHRGWSATCPENTLVAFRAALDLGVDGCECDVHLSADGVPYLLHDHSLARTCGLDQPADALPYAEIARLDAGSWKDPRFAGEAPPRLVDTIALHVGRGALVIEVKDQGDPDMVSAAVCDAIAAADGFGWCSVISFDLPQVAAVAAREPRVPCLLLRSVLPVSAGEQAALLETALTHRLVGFSLHHSAMGNPLVRTARRLGLAVWAWTVNDADLSATCHEQGAEAVCSDTPDLLLGG